MSEDGLTKSAVQRILDSAYVDRVALSDHGKELSPKERARRKKARQRARAARRANR